MSMRFRAAFLFLTLFGICIGAFAALKLPPKDVRGKVVNDLPAPSNLQVVVKNRSAALQWEWQPPEQRPLFSDFGYEVLRQDGTSFLVSTPSYQDLDLAESTYTYKVRVRGDSKEKGQRLTHVSSWSDSAEAIIRQACESSPQIELNVTSAQKTYSSIPSLRMHLTGRMQSPKGCTLQQPTYHIDAETGSSHTGPIRIDREGRFDMFADALGAEDEVPAGQTTFTVTVSAENEAGPATSPAFAVSIHLQNKFSPRE